MVVYHKQLSHLSKKHILAVVAIFCAITLPALADGVPDAGSLRQPLDREHQESLPSQGIALPDGSVVPQAQSGGVAVVVSSFHFVGNSLLSTDQLNVVVAHFVGQRLDLNGLKSAAAAVGAAYRDAGWVVRTALPHQTIENGIVIIQVIESTLGNVVIDGDVPTRVPSAQIIETVRGSQAGGVQLNRKVLERGILLANDLPGVDVTGAMREGTAERETDIGLKVVDEPLLMGRAMLDNSGSRSTGAGRVLLDASLLSPLKIGDQTDASFSHTEGSDYLWGGYTIPVGLNGLRLRVSGSIFHYRLISSDFEKLHAKGSSYSAGLGATYPIIRSTQRNLYMNASYDRRGFDNQANGATNTDYTTDALSLGLTGNLYDNWQGGGVTNGKLTLIGSDLDLNGSPNFAQDAATTRAAGYSTRLRYALSREQRVNSWVYLHGAMSGQWASKNLDSSDKFYLGGPYGVRAYPVNEGGGAQGQLINLEVRFNLPRQTQLSAFYDWGNVEVNVDNNYIGASKLNSYALRGAGLGFLSQLPAGFELNGIWARRIGDNPNPTVKGLDQDGSRHLNRFWIGLSKYF